MAETFADYLKGGMERAGVSGNLLAQKSGISQPTVSKLLNGTRNPSRDMVEKIAPALGVPTADALFAAGFVPDEGKSDGELTRVPEEDARSVYNYSKLRPVSKRLINTMIEELTEIERGDVSINGEKENTNSNGDEAGSQ